MNRIDNIHNGLVNCSWKI